MPGRTGRTRPRRKARGKAKAAARRKGLFGEAMKAASRAIRGR